MAWPLRKLFKKSVFFFALPGKIVRTRLTLAASTMMHLNGEPGTFSALNLSSTMCGFASFGTNEMAYVWLP